MKIEMHVHTKEGSSCAQADAETIVKTYSDLQYDAIVITNHFDNDILKEFGASDHLRIERYLLGYKKALKAGAHCGLKVFLGIEIRLEPGPEDFLIYGMNEDFLFRHPDLCFMNQKELYTLCHQFDALLYQAHPFRAPCIPQNPDYLDGVELNQRPDSGNHNEKLRLWLQKHPHLKLISGSDCHATDQAGFGGILLNHNVPNEKSLAECLRMDQVKLIIHQNTTYSP